MNHMELQYVRTDKNGTKYFYDWTCPRCGGAGESSMWLFTGKVCFACGGSGHRNRPLIVKEYTEEYAAKLEAKRIAKQKKYEAEHADEIAQAKADQALREAKWRKEQNEDICRTLGCDPSGVGYVLLGNTYPVKDKIKASGGRWISQAWVSPIDLEAKGVRSVRIDISGFTGQHGLIHEHYVRDIVFCIGQKYMNFEQAKEQVAEWNA